MSCYKTCLIWYYELGKIILLLIGLFGILSQDEVNLNTQEHNAEPKSKISENGKSRKEGDVIYSGTSLAGKIPEGPENQRGQRAARVQWFQGSLQEWD